MEKSLIEQAAAQALLDRGVGFQIPAPVFFKLFGKKTISISVKRLRLGTLLYVSKYIPPEELTAPQPPPAGGGEKDKEFFERKKMVEYIGGEAVVVKMKFITDNAKNVCRAIACGLLNSELKIKLFSRPLANHLRRQCTNDQLQELTMWLFAYGRAESFLNITKLLRTMRTTTPRNLGQTMERS